MIVEQALLDHDLEPAIRAGRVLAACPICHERTLSVREHPDNSIALLCYLGCSRDVILAALRLTRSDLFPKSDEVMW